MIGVADLFQLVVIIAFIDTALNLEQAKPRTKILLIDHVQVIT